MATSADHHRRSTDRDDAGGADHRRPVDLDTATRIARAARDARPAFRPPNAEQRELGRQRVRELRAALAAIPAPPSVGAASVTIGGDDT